MCRIERLVVSQSKSVYFPTVVCMKEGLREIWLAEILRNVTRYIPKHTNYSYNVKFI